MSDINGHQEIEKTDGEQEIEKTNGTTTDGELEHYGTPRHSGRYPWGSGDNPQRSKDFLTAVRELKKQGLTEKQIAEGFEMTTSQLRARKTIEREQKRKDDSALAQRLRDKGLSNVAIGERMGINESSVRALLDPTLQQRADITASISNLLRVNTDEHKYIDIGAGVEAHLGVSRTKLNTAISMLEEEGYKVQYIKVKQLGTGKYTTVKVLTPPDVAYSEVYANRDKIRMITDHYEDGGRTLQGLEPINNISRDRIAVRYGDEGGSDKDGVIELRRGVDDISLGNAKYAQVRIGVEGNQFMKGMAIYSDDIPNGKDIIYNTNKKAGTPDEKVFKPMEDNPDNPFGSVVRQKKYKDAEGKEHLSALNIVYEEGQWQDWSKSISSQVLSKQRPNVAKKQLELAFNMKKDELEEIESITNPAVKKRLLLSLADDCDSSAVHLKAAALPRQASHVLLPFTSIKPNEIYAPKYEDGENVVLIRHPHGGIFEIPELIVNNKNPEANKYIKQAKDAVGIHPSVASKLSGADFDGDTVLVIPNRDGNIITARDIKDLKDFDSKSYKNESVPKISPKTKQMKMGDVSNLITDMTIKGATQDEIVRAVKHSMVVIDSEKHHLDYKQSYLDHNIGALKKKYQGGENAGASTIISKASSEARVPSRKPQYKIDPSTGRKIYEYILDETYVDAKGRTVHRTVNSIEEARRLGVETYINKKGKRVERTTPSTKMMEIDDARKLASGTIIETVYADHANKLKALGDYARKIMVNTKDTPYSPSARATYDAEVTDLKNKLNKVNLNKPLERRAQLLANKTVSLKRQENPQMEPDDLKKLKGQALMEMRARVGAHKGVIDITDREWEAIQAGAVSSNTLSQIVMNADLDKLKQRSMPRTSKGMSPGKVARAKAMLQEGYTQAEVAHAMGVSTTTLEENIE